MDESEFILNTQALNELQEFELAEQERCENIVDVIEGSQEASSLLDEIPTQISLSDRMRLATQRRKERRKLEKTKSDSVMELKKRESITEISSLSKLIDKEMEDINFTEW